MLEIGAGGSENATVNGLARLVAVMASYSGKRNGWIIRLSFGRRLRFRALDLGGRVNGTRGGARLCWLIGGAIALGIGIWSMHYVGMLAFSLPVPIQYHWPRSFFRRD